ncbi:MAG: TAT-variant-translocated molybdopterin oxidoreductase [Candidatus Sericytochromatia bacterium]
MELQQSKPTPMYWQSLEELHGDAATLEAKGHEFKKGVTEDFDVREMSGISRRRFLAAMGASAAFALTSCKNYMGNGEVIPYNQMPENVIIGRPNYYASTVSVHGQAAPVLVTAREGRPIKIAGNPEHPITQGRLGGHYQAKIMGLYDPERLQGPTKGGAAVAWKEADDAVIAALKGLEGKRAAIITHRLQSPTAKRVLDDLVKAYPGTEVYSYGLFHDEMRNRAWKKSHGGEQFPAIHWDQPDVILALESDFLGIEGDESMHSQYATRRDVMNEGVKFNRLYTVEGNLSVTGMNADYRLRLRPDAQYNFVLALAKALGEQGVTLPGSLVSLAANANLSQLAQANGMSETALKHLVSDLAKNRGKALIYAGSRLPEAVHVLVNGLNDALGAAPLFDTAKTPVAQFPVRSDDEMKSLIGAMSAGQVGVVIHWNTNPLYDLAALSYADALAKVPMSVTLSTHGSETSAKSTYTLPVHHDLEAWGDHRQTASVINLQQPIVAPLMDTHQAEGVLLAWAAGDSARYSETLYLDYLKQSWRDVYTQTKAFSDFGTFWNNALHDGFVATKAGGASVPGFNASALNGLTAPKQGTDFVISLQQSHATLDGEFANNGWLQEIPHPVSKVVWDNYAAMSLATAKALGVKTDGKVQVQVGNATIEFPVLEQPGMADQVIAIELGYGRSEAGTIGSGVGVDGNPLVMLGSDSPWIVPGSVSKAGGKHHLVTTQIHHAFDVAREQDLHYARGIVREGNYNHFLEDPKHAIPHGHEPFDIYKPHEYKGIKWAMAIDMNKCTGCNSCIVACNVENNVPVVGPEQVDRGREMHWMRLDRYYSGTAEDPKVTQQVMLCQHCDNAPCEIVCPVNATNHSDDGLNQMAYNRCVGTRYCSNNCPYKVRRFNFFDYRDRFAKALQRKELHHLIHNPEVTVRSRGVMEKCTFCVQRIMWARQEAIREKRELKGTDVVVACQEVCPSGAIYFGDANDPNSDVAKYRKHAAGYRVLEEINARPAVTYVAQLRNTYEKA